MPGKITLKLEVDANEAEILIVALAKAATIAESAMRGDENIAKILDRLRYEIEEQIG